MTYGRVAYSLLFLALWGAAMSAIAQPRRPTIQRQPVGNAEMTVTLTGIDALSLGYQGADGRVETAAIAPSSQFLRQGLLSTPSDFSPGETARLRLRTVAKGPQVALLSDLASVAVIARCRGHLLTGNIQNLGEQALVVLPDGSPDGVPVTLRLSPKTMYRANGSSADLSAFGTGMEVVIAARGLPDGLLAAVSVSDAGPLPASHTPKLLSGTVEDFQPAASVLTILDKGGTRHFVAVNDATRITRHKQPGALADIQPGMHVTVHFGAAQDAAGNPLATSVSGS